ncbi:hypothetical protein Ddye_021487 [Dipteronia dyeriana]|uniref:Uncharacterized protein n=1 Tax=Dipteronia dyeriana TaxID=168575 RepID=A0AAD9WXS0_9ROSI|nr:hypothetical protein Ddye_021487 [Dipteronia dyeriana]
MANSGTQEPLENNSLLKFAVVNNEDIVAGSRWGLANRKRPHDGRVEFGDLLDRKSARIRRIMAAFQRLQQARVSRFVNGLKPMVEDEDGAFSRSMKWSWALDLVSSQHRIAPDCATDLGLCHVQGVISS